MPSSRDVEKKSHIDAEGTMANFHRPVVEAENQSTPFHLDNSTFVGMTSKSETAVESTRIKRDETLRDEVKRDSTVESEREDFISNRIIRGMTKAEWNEASPLPKEIKQDERQDEHQLDMLFEEVTGMRTEKKQSEIDTTQDEETYQDEDDREGDSKEEGMEEEWIEESGYFEGHEKERLHMRSWISSWLDVKESDEGKKETNKGTVIILHDLGTHCYSSDNSAAFKVSRAQTSQEVELAVLTCS